MVKLKKKPIWELQSLFKIICLFWISYEFVAQHEYNLVIKSREPYCTCIKTPLRKFSGMIQIKTLIWTLLTWLGIYWKLPMFWKAFNKYNTWKCWMYRDCSQTETVNWQWELEEIKVALFSYFEYLKWLFFTSYARDFSNT